MDLEYKDVTDIIDASGLKITANFEKCRSYLCLILCVCVFIVFLQQGYPNLVLEGRFPAVFSCNLLEHTCQEVSSMPSKSLIS